MQEGLFLYTHNVSPYDGGVYHQAPLLLSIFSLLPNPRNYPLATGLLYTAIDLQNAKALMTISDSGESVTGRFHNSLRKHIRWDGASIAAWYLFNPFVLASCLGRSTTAFTNLAILQAISSAVTGNPLNTMIALGFASYLSLYPILLFPPLILLCYDRLIVSKKKVPGQAIFTLANLGILVLVVAGFLLASFLVTGFSWEFIPATYGAHLLVPDLTPNAGLWWYFFIEMFDSFREFFLGVFWLHLAGYVGGLTVRLRRQPLFVITTLVGIFAIYKPYPSIVDVSLYFALLPLYRHLAPCE